MVKLKKMAKWLIGAVSITIFAVTFAFMIEKVTVTASEIALTDQGWHANFSAPLKMNVHMPEDLYITDHNGKRVDADITFKDNRKTVHVEGLEPGTYTLHVKKNALKGKPFKSFTANEIKFTVHETLETIASAEELKAYFERAKKSLGNSRGMMEVTEESATLDSSANDKAAESPSGGSDHSTTNNQVEGVDEADLVKTDGDYIYAMLGNGKITVTDIRDPKKLRAASAIKMEEGFYPSQLFLHGDTLIVLGGKFESDKGVSNDVTVDRIMPGGKSMTTVRLYDVSIPEKPSLIREIGAEGYLNGARKTDDMLYFVTNVQPNFWIMEDVLGDLLRPHISDSKYGEESTMMPYKDISILPGAMEPTYSVITAIDLSSPAENRVVTKGYLGSSEQLYMSKDNLYLTATIYEVKAQGKSMIWNPAIANSELFKFTLKGTNVNFQSSATLKGHLLNQFSMDEHNGYFRVVTTEGNSWDDKMPSKNHLFILDEKLKITGSVEGLAKGERIYSARFMGDKAYMVTFKETDPLFVIDVANPAAPKVLGELKIPGFSNYLHPLDENHLIGFGYETVAQKNPAGGAPFILTQGMKVSLFDVSDFANPKEQDTEIIGGRGTYSQIQYDHKALFQHRERNLYGFPVIVYKETGKNQNFENVEFQSSGALIYEITPEKGIVLKGDLLVKRAPGEQYGDYETEIQRLLYSKDTLYTISMKDIKNYSLDSFAPIGSLEIK